MKLATLYLDPQNNVMPNKWFVLFCNTNYVFINVEKLLISLDSIESTFCELTYR
jgi:hypothetical protein